MREEWERLEGHDRSALFQEMLAKLSLERRRYSSSYANNLAKRVGLAVSLLDHLPGSGSVAVLHAEDVDGEHALEVLLREVEKGLDLGDTSVGDPGISDQYLTDHCTCHVAMHTSCLAARALARSSQSFSQPR